MKLFRPALFVAGLVAAASLAFADAAGDLGHDAPPLCCAAAEAKPAETHSAACCSPASSPAAALPLSARSIYQLDATWTDDAGQSFSLSQLRGRPVVLTMFFASCEGACPILVAQMQRIRNALPAAVRAETRFVLVCFDAARDTPAALRAYRDRLGLSDQDWTLLHGEPADIQELAMVLGVSYKQDAGGQFAHSNVITVLNRQGEIAHQRNGLQGEIDPTARALVAAAR
jgi:protein SCO1/2